MRGVQWQQEQVTRLALVAAHTTAALVRYPRKKRLPSIKSLLQTPERGRQTSEEQKHLMREWAQRLQGKGFAVRIGRIDQAPEPFQLKDPGPGRRSPRPRQRPRHSNG